MPLKKIVLATALSLPLAVAHAALINADTNLGPGTAVIDTSTNLEWLKVSATSGLTPDQVFAEMAPGGRLEGYHYASYDAVVCRLIPSQIPGARCSANWSTRDVGPVFAFLDQFGTRFDQVVIFQAESPTVPFPQSYGESMQLTTFSDGVQDVFFDAQMVPLTTQPANHWLVRSAPAPLPEPSTISLLGLAAVALLSRKPVPNAR